MTPSHDEGEGKGEREGEGKGERKGEGKGERKGRYQPYRLLNLRFLPVAGSASARAVNSLAETWWSKVLNYLKKKSDSGEYKGFTPEQLQQLKKIMDEQTKTFSVLVEGRHAQNMPAYKKVVNAVDSTISTVDKPVNWPTKIGFLYQASTSFLSLWNNFLGRNGVCSNDFICPFSCHYEPVLYPMSPFAWSILEGPILTRSTITQFVQMLDVCSVLLQESIVAGGGALLLPNETACQMIDEAACAITVAILLGSQFGKVGSEDADVMSGLVKKVSAIMKMQKGALQELHQGELELQCILPNVDDMGSLQHQSIKFLNFVGHSLHSMGILPPVEMGSPGFFDNIGNDARKILFDDYLKDFVVKVKSDPCPSLSLASVISNANDVNSYVQMMFSNSKFHIDMQANLQADVLATIKARDLFGKGYSALLAVDYPAFDSSKVEILYENSKVGLAGSYFIGSPFITLSCLYGTNELSFGCKLKMNTMNRRTYFSAGLNASRGSSSVGFTLSDHSTLNLWMYHAFAALESFPGKLLPRDVLDCFTPKPKVESTPRSALAAGISFNIDSGKGNVEVGLQHENIKLAICTPGVVRVQMKQPLLGRSFITACAEFNVLGKATPLFGAHVVIQ